MNKRRTQQINLVQLALYILKRCWLLILCAAVGFGLMYYRASKRPDAYTTSGTMYIVNANPNLVNYGYTNTSDLNSAVALINTYSVVVRSELVMNRVLEYQVDARSEDGTVYQELLSQKYPGLTAAYIANSISMSSVNETGMVRVSCTTNEPEKSADICNAVLQVAPDAIKQVVGAGQAEMVDSAKTPLLPNSRGEINQGLRGALVGAVAAAALLELLFLLNRKVTGTDDLTDNYTPPVLTSIKRSREKSEDAGQFLLSEKSPMEVVESYAKLRMNLFYTLVERPNRAVVVTSAVSGEGKSTIAANLAISCAISGKRVLLIDADMRRACQQDIFHYDPKSPGLSDVLAGTARWKDVLLDSGHSGMIILPAGTIPPNPAELLESRHMDLLLEELGEAFDLILMDVPPVNIVSDPLALSGKTAGALFVVRQNFSDHREIRRALTAAEMTDMNLLGFIFYGENLRQGNYYSRKYYKSYYHKYDNRARAASAAAQSDGERKLTGESFAPDDDKKTTEVAPFNQNNEEESTHADERSQEARAADTDSDADRNGRRRRSRGSAGTADSDIN